MSKVVSIRQPKAIDALVVEIREHLYDAQGAKTKLDKHRLAAGQKLLELRGRIEAGEIPGTTDWWPWFETAEIGRSRSDAEKLMRIASADDPEKALETEQSRVREAVVAHREKQSALRNAESGSDDYDIVSHAMNLVAKMGEEEREAFDETYMEKYHG